MKKYARVLNGKVIEVVNAPDGFTPSDLFHPSIAKDFMECGAEVSAGWVRDENGFSNPNTGPVNDP